MSAVEPWSSDGRDRGPEFPVDARALFDALPVPCVLCDDADRIHHLNHAFIDAFGYTLDDMPTVAHWWPLAYPDVADRAWAQHMWRARLAESHSRGRSHQAPEARITCKHGTARRVTIDVTALATGTSGMRLVVLHDVTESRAHGRDLAQVAADRERRHGLALHEGLSQQLAGLASMVSAAARRAADTPPDALVSMLERLATLARECVSTSRDIARGVSPLALRAERLIEALDDLVRMSCAAGVDTSLRAHPLRLENVGPLVARAAYWIAEEALANARRHAAPRHVHVDVWMTDHHLVIEIGDDGGGFTPEQVDGGAGLGGMQQMARAVAGWVVIESTHGAGTTVRAHLPHRTARQDVDASA